MSLGLIAFILSAVAASGCAFLTISGSVCYPQLGLFKYNGVIQCTLSGAVYSGCTKYDNPTMLSGSNKAAQAMGAIAATFGGILWAGCIFMLFFKFPACMFKTIGGVFIFCFATQMLTLLALMDCTGDSADALKIADPAFQCNLGSDGAISIAAAILYLVLGVTILVCPVPKTAVLTCFGDCCKNICGEDEEACGCCSEDATQGAVIETSGTRGGGNTSSTGVNQASNSTVTETNNDDGTVTVKEEQINPDGSITVSVTTRSNASAVSASV